MLSIVDLGMVRRRGLEADRSAWSSCRRSSGARRSSCIRTVVGDDLRRSAALVEVTTFDGAVDDRPDHPGGPAALRAAGIAPPAARPTPLPAVRLARRTRDNLFGPTQCRSLHYCRTCRQPFEAMKPI